MFLDLEQARARLESEDNLANRFSRSGCSQENSARIDEDSSRVPPQGPQEEDNGDLSPPDNEDRISIVPKLRAGKDAGEKNLAPVVRNTIAILARTGETQTSIGKAFGVHQTEVSAIHTGKVQGVEADKVEKALGEMRDKALEKLMSSLNLITDEKLGKCKATDLSVVAANMSKIVEKSLPRQQDSRDINLVVYAPELRQERNFKTIEI